MIECRMDGRFYASQDDFPDYGQWFLLSQEGNIRTYAGDTDTSKLPQGSFIPPTSKAITTNGSLYSYDGTQWRMVK